LRVELETLGIPSFAEWEEKLLKQEILYFQDHLASLDGRREEELEQKLTASNFDGKTVEKIERAKARVQREVDEKYAKHKAYLEKSLRKAEIDLIFFERQKHQNKYRRQTEKYAFPPDFKQASF